MPASMSRLHARSVVDNKSQYFNRSTFLTRDNSLVPFDRLDRMMGEAAQPTIRFPLGRLCNLHVDSIVANVSGAWSYIGKGGLSIPSQSSGRDVPPSPTAAEVQHTLHNLSSPTMDGCAGGHATHPSVARTLQTFRTGLPPREVTWAVKIAASHSPIARASKHPRTPFPVTATNVHRSITESDPESLSSKRSRTAVSHPRIDVPPFTVGGRGRGNQTSLHQLVEWLTSYLYFLISDPDRRSSRVTSLADFPAQEAAMDKILDILVHYHPDNSIIFLALWYLVRLFPKALMSRAASEHDTIELMSRLFLLGLTFANKWLNDFPMPLKDWNGFCSLPLSSIHELERSALAILGYNISISNTDWVSWMFDMRNSALSHPSPCDKISVVAIVNGLLKTGPKVSGQCSHSRLMPIARPTPFELSSNLYSQVTHGLRAIPYTKPLHAICEPAPWNPARDPIITPRTHGRTNGTAPSALPRATTALDLLVSILTK